MSPGKEGGDGDAAALIGIDLSQHRTAAWETLLGREGWEQAHSQALEMTEGRCLPRGTYGVYGDLGTQILGQEQNWREVARSARAKTEDLNLSPSFSFSKLLPPPDLCSSKKKPLSDVMLSWCAHFKEKMQTAPQPWTTGNANTCRHTSALSKPVSFLRRS